MVAGSKPGRESDEEITTHKSVGVAVEDIVAADLVYQRALAARN
jgi:ornithine cyclodeaminase/alanine dehydrogenase-like protein (mu-crystallin family)